jgi:hypothetical protein
MAREPCACGCGQIPVGPTSRYLPGHNIRRPAIPAAGPERQMELAKRRWEKAEQRARRQEALSKQELEALAEAEALTKEEWAERFHVSRRPSRPTASAWCPTTSGSRAWFGRAIWGSARTWTSHGPGVRIGKARTGVNRMGDGLRPTVIEMQRREKRKAKEEKRRERKAQKKAANQGGQQG